MSIGNVRPLRRIGRGVFVLDHPLGIEQRQAFTRGAEAERGVQAGRVVRAVLA